MSYQFKGYAIRSGDRWWSRQFYEFMSAPDHSSFTPTYDGSAKRRVATKITELTKTIKTMKELYSDSYVPPNDYICHSRANKEIEIANFQLQLDIWKNVQVVEVTVTVTENQ